MAMAMDKRRIWLALAAAAAGAALSYAGVLIQRRVRDKREVSIREELLDKTICDTMDASDAVAKY